ncbi:MAG TPA: hypothetical protein PK760_02510 [Flavobacteriales bacterium]|nr:hypothetical protein [Flavobacteriales bacterium]
MTLRSISLFFILTGTLLHGQALLILPGAEDPDALHFNERFIARNKVASVTGERMIKRDGQPMRTEPTRYLYRFDAEGRMAYANNSLGNPGTGRDTTSTTYNYDAQGHAVRRLRNDFTGHFAYDTEYDSTGRAKRETYARIENLGTDRYNLTPGATTQISDERFKYITINDTCWRKTYYNYLDLPYREETFTRNALGYLLLIEDRYLISERRSRIRFTYDEGGRLASRMEQRDISKSDEIKHTWSYDVAGNVISNDLWHGAKQKYHEEYLYEEQSMMLKARIRKDSDTGIIHVIRYHTELRP